MPDLPVFWPTPESAMPNQVTETEGQIGGLCLPLLQVGARIASPFVVAEERYNK